MEADSPEPREVLREARSAASEGDFETALSKYEFFFDHALDDDPAALYGVRLSYCLDEWAQIGEKFDPARAALVNRKKESLRLFGESKELERFHDFVAICGYLKCTDEAIAEFARLSDADFQLADRVYRFIRKELVRASEWELCGRHVKEGMSAYEFALTAFDQTWAIGKTDTTIGGSEYESWVRRMYVEEVANLLSVLKNCERNDECDAIWGRIAEDVDSREQDDLLGKVRDAFEARLAPNT